MMGLDGENYGTKDWNPLKHFVKPGQTILIKPNLVMDHNENKKYRDNLDCVVTHTSCIRAICDYCIIALGKTGNEQYQVSDYNPDQTRKFHHGRVHDYIISEIALQADFIINFSKPKTHRLAGFTGAMKNMVGITFDKASLPHRQAGSPDMGGDAYSSKSIFKKWADCLLIKKLLYESKQRKFTAFICRVLYLAFRLIGNYTTKNESFVGSWPGNDTIWRTVADLNNIVKYSDKSGVMQKSPQRKLLFFGDLVISGEHNGPVAPTPKNLGVVISSTDALEMDTVLCKMMGLGILISRLLGI